MLFLPYFLFVIEADYMGVFLPKFPVNLGLYEKIVRAIGMQREICTIGKAGESIPFNALSLIICLSILTQFSLVARGLNYLDHQAASHMC